MARASRAALLLGAVLVGALLQGARTSTAAGELTVVPVGQVNSAGYPQVEATVSVVEASTGRPLSELTAANVAASDESGRVSIVGVKPVETTAEPVAYVLLLDTSKGMADPRSDGKDYLDRVLNVADQFRAGLGKDDLVRLVAFNEGAEARTNWVRRDDPNFVEALSAIQQLTVVDKPVNLTGALLAAAREAQTPPPGYKRRAVVLVTRVDGRGLEPQLTLDTINTQLRVPFFTFGLGNAATVQEQYLTQFYEDLAKQSGGAFWPLDASDIKEDARAKLMFSLMRRAWQVTLRADGLPDGHEHAVTIGVTTADGHSGEAKTGYQSGTLGQVTKVQFTGLAEGDRVTKDRSVSAWPTGDKTWRTVKVELFRDCEPGTCSPVATGDGRPAEWNLAVGPLDQGSHQLFARVTATDGTREFVDVASLTFERGGTTFNFAVIFLVSALAVLAVGVTVIATTRKGVARRPTYE